MSASESSVQPIASSQPDEPIVITIDGPAGAGKSTVARMLADRLGFTFLDTGAMYRCVTLIVLRSGIPLSDQAAVESAAAHAEIDLDGPHVEVNGEDVSAQIRTPEVSAAIGLVADNLGVRHKLTQLQRRWASGKRIVTEGRDQGSVVFPNAACKVYLTASSEERARRRHRELVSRGIDLPFEEVLAQQCQRDADDMARPVGGLCKAPDAVEICTDNASLDQVVEQLAVLVRRQLGSRTQQRNG